VGRDADGLTIWTADRLSYGGAVPVDRPLIAALRAGLAAVADPDRAPAMQAYMKSRLPYYGVSAPVARRVFTAVLREHPVPDRPTWEATVRALWDGAEHREERYGALAMCGHRLYRGFQDPATLALYADLVVTGAWWDLVDDLAAHKVGPILRGHHEQVRPVVLGWATDDDLWLRRTAIIAQLGAKAGTDLDLLEACIEPSLDRREFFLRKAIGWALRQYAWTDPVWVRDYVRRHDDRLSALSRREALKNVGAG
jgi:3-methyladenine DNA glycosylase AlkD